MSAAESAAYDAFYSALERANNQKLAQRFRQGRGVSASITNWGGGGEAKTVYGFSDGHELTVTYRTFGGYWPGH